MITLIPHSNYSPFYSLLISCGCGPDKVHILLEELGVAYDPHTINISIGEQLTPEFIAINPNNRIPALVDPTANNGTPLRIFESGAILIYLAEKEGKFLPTSPEKKAEVLSWLMWQMGGVGPMFGKLIAYFLCRNTFGKILMLMRTFFIPSVGQFGHFARREEKLPYPIERYGEESKRLMRILNRQLEGKDWVAAGKTGS